MDQIDQDTVGRMVHHEDKRTQFKFRNVLMVLAMGMGSLSYGYSANVIAASLAQPTFIKYFGLDTRSDANAVKACMTVSPSSGSPNHGCRVGVTGQFC